MWTFKHPTVGDAYAALLLHNPEWLGIYVRGSPIDKLLGQVTCGDVGLERAVVLPKSLFPLVLKRLKDSSSTRYKTPFLAIWHIKDRFDNFLASRCSKEFVTEYINGHPEVLDRVSKPGLFLSSVSEVDLAIGLHELGLLPEKYRRDFVTTVVDYAIEGEDLYAIKSHRIQSVFTSDELAAFRERVRAELLPKLADVRWTWQSNCGSDQRPDEHMEPLLESFSGLKEEFADDLAVLGTIDRQIELARDWIAEKMADNPKRDRPALTFGAVDSPDSPPAQTRGIFDDIDE